MDRGAWPATVHGVSRVKHDLATKPGRELGDVMAGLGMERVRQKYIHHLHSVPAPLPGFQGVPVSWTCQTAVSICCMCVASEPEFP